MVDGCTRFQAFRLAVIPVMWPGVVTTGLFSFLLAYNDFTVTSMLLAQDNQTMVPKIASFLGSTLQQGDVMYAVAAVVSAIAPLFVLVMFFQLGIWGTLPTTIIVLVAINQPFTLWMLHSF